MRKLMTGSLAAFLTLTNLAHAESISVDAMPVVLGSRCQGQLRSPGSSMGYIYSGDCKTVFVLPAAEGKVSVPSFAPTTHLMLCGEVGTYSKNFKNVNSQLNKLLIELGRAESESRIRTIKSKMEAFKEYLTVTRSVFDKKEGAVAQLVFKNAVEQNDIDQWVIQNAEVMRSQGVSFRPAALGKSVLTMAIKPAQDVAERAVLESDIPGMSIQADNSYKTLNFKGALSGKVVLSLFGACSLIDKVPENLKEVRNVKPLDSALSAHLVANQSFDVPTRMQMRYDAVLRKDKVVQMMNRMFQEKGKDLKISEFVLRHGGANVTEVVDMNLFLSELDPAQQAVWDKFQQSFGDDVLKRLTDKFVKELEELGIVDLQEYKRAEAPEAGDVEVPTVRRFCSSDSLFGIQTSSSCSDRVVMLKKRVSGSSELIDEQSVNIQAAIEEHYVINQPFFYNFTSTFSPVVK